MIASVNGKQVNDANTITQPMTSVYRFCDTLCDFILNNLITYVTGDPAEDVLRGQFLMYALATQKLPNRASNTAPLWSWSVSAIWRAAGSARRWTAA